MHKQINRSRLVVCTNNGTTFLETLAANIPTIVFWNPTHWQLTEQAQSDFETLSKHKIFHSSPKSAASFLNTVYENPSLWWNSFGLQEARKKFCNTYAQTDEKALKLWKNIITQH